MDTERSADTPFGGVWKLLRSHSKSSEVPNDTDSP
jgi:hypothetical protein